MKHLILISLIYFILKCVISATPKKDECLEDLYIAKGKGFAIKCTLKKDSINLEGFNYTAISSNIYLSHQNHLINNLTIISNESAVYEVEEAEFSDSGSYNCYVRTPKSPEFLCSYNVFIGEPPEPINKDSFHCESQNLRNLTCKWKPNKLTDLSEVTYELRMFPYGVWPYGLFSCAVKINSTSCQWRIDTNPPYLLSPPKYIFLLESENKFGKISQKFFYNHFDMIIPAKPQEFQDLYTSATAVALQWEPPEYIEYDDYARSQLQYQLKVKQMRRDEDAEVSVLDIGNTESYTVNNLIPYTNYEIRIRCRLANGTSEEKWSKESTVFTKTKDSIPYKSPKFITFESKGEGEKRNITLLWTTIQPKYYNGDNFHYLIRYFPFNIKSDYEVTEQIVPSTQTSFTVTNLGVVSYRFAIFSENVKGRCNDYSSLVVPEVHRLAGKRFKLQLRKQSSNFYTLTWINPMYEKENATSFVVIWCLSSNYFECKESPHSMYVNSSSAVESINITTNKEGVYRFGVAAKGSNWTSGVLWITSDQNKDDTMDSASPFTFTRMVAFSLLFILIGVGFAFSLICVKTFLDHYWSIKKLNIKLPEGLQKCNCSIIVVSERKEGNEVCGNCQLDKQQRHSSASNDSAFVDMMETGYITL